MRESGNGEVHGNKKSKIYHLPECPGYTGMHSASVIAFANEAEAEQAGYRKAKNVGEDEDVVVGPSGDDATLKR